MGNLKTVVMVISIGFSAALGYWTMNEENFVGQCVADVCTGGAGMARYVFSMVQNAFIVGVATASTVGALLQIQVPVVQVPPKK